MADQDDGIPEEDFALTTVAQEDCRYEESVQNDVQITETGEGEEPSTIIDIDPCSEDDSTQEQFVDLEECTDNTAMEGVSGEENALVVKANNNKLSTLEQSPCTREGHWTLDSGCSRHMTPVKSEFTRYLKLNVPVPVNLADESKIFGYGIGDVNIKLFDGSTFVPVVIKNVLYVPQLHRKLLSISDITDRGSSVTFKGQSSTITMKGKTFLFGQRHGKLWHLYCDKEDCFSNFVGDVGMNDISKKIWHQRYAHLSGTYLDMLQSKDMVNGLSYNPKIDSSICEGCIYGKQHRFPFPKESK